MHKHAMQQTKGFAEQRCFRKGIKIQAQNKKKYLGGIAIEDIWRK